VKGGVMGGRPKEVTVGGGPVVNLPRPGDDVDIEDAEAAAVSYGYLRKWRFPNGATPGPRLGSILKRQLKDSAKCVPWFAEKAEELGLDPDQTTIGAVFTMAMVKQAIENPSSQASMELLRRVDGVVKQDVNVTGLGIMKHQVALEGLSEEILEAMIRGGKMKDVIDAEVVSEAETDDGGAEG